jgi:UDP-glucose 4-epimerase
VPDGYSKILVTGGAGFIGSHIVNRLLSDDFEVTVVDNLNTGRLENIEHNDRQNFHFVKGEVQDFNLAREVLKDIDVVLHEAALTNVTSSFEDPLKTHDVNVTGTLNLLKNCVDTKVKRFIFASSASIYGETDVLPIVEEVTPKPLSPYAVTKLAAESYVRLFFKAYGLETVCLRFFNVYGPKQQPSAYSGVISIFINRALQGQSLLIYGNGHQTRDFVNIQDVVDANMLTLTSKNAVGEVFNIATGTATSINQLAKTISQILGKESLTIDYMNSRPGDIKASYADISKARRILGYSPKITLKEGLAKLIDWYKQCRRNEDG